MNNAQLVQDISGSYDAFTRLRISEPFTLFDSKTLYNKLPFYWDEEQTSGSGTTSTFNTNQASTTLSVSNATAGTIVRQTKQRFSYQPGKSQLVMMSSILGACKTGITTRVGYFDENNGLFFEANQNGYCIVKRTYTSGSPIEDRIYQTNWNKYKLSVEHYISIDFTKVNVFYFNFEWLGTGDIVCGVLINNSFIPLHHIEIANKSLFVSIGIPNLPCRYEINNNGSGTQSNLTAICSTVLSEGGREVTGIPRSINRGVVPVTVPKFNALSPDVFYPLIAIRCKSSMKGVSLYLQGFDILVTNNSTIFRWIIQLNPTFSGTAITYTGYNANSALEYANTITAATTITGGDTLYHGYGIGTGSKNITNSELGLRNSLGFTIAGVSDVIVFAAQLLNKHSDTVYADLSIAEVY